MISFHLFPTTAIIGAVIADRKSEVQEIFDDIDSNDDKLISLDEMAEAMEETFDVGRDLIEKLFNKFDSNKDGKLDVDEFDKLLLALDANNDGEITEEEVLALAN